MNDKDIRYSIMALNDYSFWRRGLSAIVWMNYPQQLALNHLTLS